MSEHSSPGWQWAAGVFTLALIAAVILWLRSRRKSPQEKERIRRLAVHLHGRLTDAELLDGPESSPPGNLLYYTYRASGVEYTAAQDVSSLNQMIHPEHCRPGNTASVKYDPRVPSNSIVICEHWSGLRPSRQGGIERVR